MASKYAVLLLKSRILGLGQEKPDPDNTDCQEDRKEDVGSPLPGLKHGRHEERNGKVIDPVARRTDRGALGTDGQGEDLRDESPRAWAPGGTEACDVQPNKS